MLYAFSRGMFLGWEASSSLAMVVVGKVKRREKDRNGESTGVLEGHGQENNKNEGAWPCSPALRRPCQISGIVIRSTGKGHVVPSSIGWPCEIFRF